MSKQSYFKQLNLAYVHILVLFDSQIWPYQVLPLRVCEPGSDGKKGTLHPSKFQ